MNLYKRFFSRFAALICAFAAFALALHGGTDVSAMFSSSYLDTGDVSVTVNTSSGHKAISPYIYGINAEASLSGLTVNAVKQSDPRVSSYNWETNFSNSAEGKNSSNGISLVETYPQGKQQEAALYTENLITRAKRYGIASRYVTLQMMGFVAADSRGPIYATDDNSRWNRVFASKNDSLLSQPDLNDGAVYMDEYVSFLANKYGYAVDGGINGYFLDYEPENWAELYPHTVTEPITAAELVSRSAVLAGAVKKIDPTALVYGPSTDGIEAFINLKNPVDWEQYSQEYSWFIDYYLMRMKAASEIEGTRLLDVLDVHYHTEATNGLLEPIINADDSLSNNARLQAPRILWDSTYTENSTVAIMHNQHIPLIPTLEASINMYYPGTRLSFSEYNFGGGDHISGGISTADTLGIFASYGVHMACLHPNSTNIDYQKSAINIYTNYDGEGADFGNTLVKSDNGGDIMSSVYAAIDGQDESTLKMVLINKNQSSSKTAEVAIKSKTSFESARVYSFNEDSPEIVLSEETVYVEDNSFSFEMDPLTVYMLVFEGSDGEVLIDVPMTGETTVTSASESINESNVSSYETETSVEETTSSAPEHVEAETYSSAGTSLTEDTEGEPDGGENAETSVSIVGTDADGSTLTEIISSGQEFPDEDPDASGGGKVPAAVKVIVCIMVSAVVIAMLYVMFGEAVQKKFFRK